MQKIRDILLRYWGFSNFRPMQEEIIQSVLDGKDTLALLPTGGGKSICFQVPALAKDGLCIVVTPLIALMKDQVENLKKKGIKAVAVYSGMHRHEISMAFDNCMFGDIKFLYLSPERLQTEQFQLVLQKMKVCLLAVDEAHCVSQWGYDFRPPYLKVADIRRFLPGVPVLALTATATADVIKDIQQKLGFSKENVFRKSFERKNLTYLVIKEEDKLGRLLRILRKVQGPGIVYVRNRRKTAETASFLNKQGIRADFYHAGLDVKARDHKQEAWIREVNRIMVATNAFGMGIDKPNVRVVVHLDLPDSLEAYFQEAGRGGRDEKRAYAVILVQPSDIIRLKDNIDKEYPPPEKIREVYQALGNYLQLPVGSGKDEPFNVDINAFSRNYGFNPVIAFSALRLLEREGYLALNEGIENPSRIHFEAGREEIYRYQVQNKSLDPFIKLLLRSYSGVFTEFVPVNEAELARRAEVTEEDVRKNLTFLQKGGILTYVPGSAKPQIIFITERMETKNLLFTQEHYHARKKMAVTRMEAVREYANSADACRSQVLLGYFGEGNAQRCGRCDVCLERNKMDLNEIEFEAIREFIRELLEKGPKTLPELVFNCGQFSEDHVLLVIRWLQDKGVVELDDTQRYKWRKQFKLKLL